MKSGWFWPLYGDADEVMFTYSNSRGRAHIEQVLNDQFSGTLISDGYTAYARYAQQQPNITHAQCWVHHRRYLVEAQKDHPEQANEALQRISQHPASQVADLTPRLWKLRFADKPLRSLVDPRHPDRQASRSL